MFEYTALAGFYVAEAGQISTGELVPAALAAALATVFSILFADCAKGALRLNAPWLKLSFRVALALIRDTARVGAALVMIVLRGGGGQTAKQVVRQRGRGGAAAGHKAMATLLASLAPNSYVLEERRLLRLHRLVSVAPSLDAEWPI